VLAILGLMLTDGCCLQALFYGTAARVYDIDGSKPAKL